MVESRLAVLEQAVADHLKHCEERNTDMIFQLRCVRRQLKTIETKFDEGSAKFRNVLIAVLFSVVVALISYIWIDHLTKGQDDVYRTPSSSQPRIYPLQR